ncbi:MAG: hypothetical protein WC479_10405 [Candidatus Izemoplasmatales bacterium]
MPFIEESQPQEREELCVYCMKPVKDWVEPDWAIGRICRECETIHEPPEFRDSTETVSEATVKKAQDSIAKLRAEEAKGKSVAFWSLWFHRLHQWDINCIPILCIHWRYDKGNGCRRIFCIWRGGIEVMRKRIRWCKTRKDNHG